MRPLRLALSLLALVTILMLGPAATHHAIVMAGPSATLHHGCCPGTPPVDRQLPCPHLPVLAAAPLPETAVMCAPAVRPVLWSAQSSFRHGRSDAPDPPPPRRRLVA
jgi:hypothetical protein